MKKLFVTLVTFATITTMTGCMSLAAGTVANMALPYAESLLTKQLPTGVTGQSDLVGSLVQQLGVSPQQAMSGTGSIFSVAQQNMNPNDFTQLSQSVPNMNQYLSAVPAQTTGATTGGVLGSMGLLAGSFQNLGLNADMASKFLPIVLQYVQTQGGASTMGLLQSALLQ